MGGTRVTTPHDRAWHERRLDGFGGSEAGALLGVSPWRTARQVVEDKGRRIIADPDAPERLRFRLGRDMEPILLRHLYEHLLEQAAAGTTVPKPRANARRYRMPGAPWITAEPDGFVGPDVVELKTDEYDFGWGPEDAEPAKSMRPTYYAQVQHELAATGRAQALLFVQVGFHEQRLYRVPRSEQYVADLVDWEGGMWQRVVSIRDRLANDPLATIEDLLPANEGTALTDQLAKAHPKSTGVIRSATADQERLLADLRSAKRNLAVATSRWDLIKAQVQDVIKEADGITGPLGTVTWRTSKDGEPTVAHDLVAAAYRSLIVTARDKLGYQLEDWAVTEDGDPLDTIVGLYTQPGKPGSRTFLVPQAWTKEA